MPTVAGSPRPSTEDLILGTRWAESGAMALTGRPDGPALGAPASLVAGLTGLDLPMGVDPLALLGERAAFAGLQRMGDVACGGTTRLVAAADSWVAVSLPRPADIDALSAWLEVEGPSPARDPWPFVASAVAARSGAELVTRAGWLGLAVCRLGEATGSAEPAPAIATPLGADRPDVTVDIGSATVVDLSSLWAGPLCGHLLQLAGARVIKVESATRPDGARVGSVPFFDLLHAGQESVALDLASGSGQARLRQLVGAADVVITSARPRALFQLGIAPEHFARDDNPTGPCVYVAITGHGLSGPSSHRVAFGDDAAVAGALVVRDDDGPMFCGDAIADPLTGILATRAALDACARGGRWLVDVSMARVAAALAGNGRPVAVPAGISVAPPRARPSRGRAPRFGVHTEAVLREFTTAASTS